MFLESFENRCPKDGGKFPQEMKREKTKDFRFEKPTTPKALSECTYMKGKVMGMVSINTQGSKSG